MTRNSPDTATQPATHRAPAGEASSLGCGAAGVLGWLDERYAMHKAERREAVARGDDYSAAFAVGAMLELLELRGLLSSGESA